MSGSMDVPAQRLRQVRRASAPHQKPPPPLRFRV